MAPCSRRVLHPLPGGHGHSGHLAIQDPAAGVGLGGGLFPHVCPCDPVVGTLRPQLGCCWSPPSGSAAQLWVLITSVFKHNSLRLLPANKRLWEGLSGPRRCRLSCTLSPLRVKSHRVGRYRCGGAWTRCSWGSGRWTAGGSLWGFAHGRGGPSRKSGGHAEPHPRPAAPTSPVPTDPPCSCAAAAGSAACASPGTAGAAAGSPGAAGPARSGAVGPTACAPAGGAAAACAQTGTRALYPPAAVRAGAARPGLKDTSGKVTQVERWQGIWEGPPLHPRAPGTHCQKPREWATGRWPSPDTQAPAISGHPRDRVRHGGPTHEGPHDSPPGALGPGNAGVGLSSTAGSWRGSGHAENGGRGSGGLGYSRRLWTRLFPK